MSAGARDPLDMTLRELLSAITCGRGEVDPDGWVNIRSEQYPWRHIVAAAERGECQVSRVGRKLMMQRSELSKFLSTRRIVRKRTENDAPEPEGEYADVVQRALRENGYGR